MEATLGVEPRNGSFAGFCLTTWLCRHLLNPYLKSCAKAPKNLQENLKNTKSLLVFLALLLRSFISKIFDFLGFKGGGARSRT